MLLLSLLLLVTAPVGADCSYDRAAMLALDEDQFDQDLDGGWRALENRGCLAEAADLLRAYRDAVPRRSAALLIWHEGQLRATMGQTDQAIALFEQARKPVAEDSIGWNHYVDGSIAFLRHDRPALQAARDRLAQVPPPAERPTFTLNGQTVTPPWPLNLNVLDGFLACFDRSYADAYGPECSKPMKLEAVPPSRD
ncbi:MAG: hypothetical protein ACOY45_10415 [Pseudomonadota bacterium]